MSGAYLTVKRDGEWLAVEVEFLTDAERDVLFLHRPPAELVRWLNVVCRTLAQTDAATEAQEP